MPEISRFFGIIITMYHNDHEPPHFHARYGGHKAILSIETLAVSRGYLPARALGLVIEWAARHRDELFRNWEAAKAHGPMRAIEPLE